MIKITTIFTCFVSLENFMKYELMDKILQQRNMHNPTLINMTVQENAFMSLFSCNTSSQECFHPLMELLDALITDTNQSHPQATSPLKRDLIRLLIKHLTPNVAVCLEKESKSLQTVYKALKCETVVESPGETAQLLIIGQVFSLIFYIIVFIQHCVLLQSWHSLHSSMC